MVRDFEKDRETCSKASRPPWSTQAEPPPVEYPWFDSCPAGATPIISRGTPFAFGVAVAVFAESDDAAFAAAAREGWPAALAELSRLSTENGRLREALRSFYIAKDPAGITYCLSCLQYIGTREEKEAHKPTCAAWTALSTAHPEPREG